MARENPCSARVRPHWESRRDDLETLFKLYWEDSEAYDDDLGNLYEYGLSFDYVTPETFTNQPQAYFRFQISWGGPSDEIRFYVNPDLSMYRAEYWFLDWFDGAEINVTREDVVRDLWNWFSECGLDHLMEEAS